MAKIIAIDYGGRRCGIAETDDFQIIASPLGTVETKDIHVFLESYFQKNKVDTVVIGLPLRMSGEVSEIETDILKFIKKLSSKYPDIRVERINEAFTSKRAMEAMVQSGTSKKKRREKGNLDKISATLILQEYLEINRNKNYE